MKYLTKIADMIIVLILMIENTEAIVIDIIANPGGNCQVGEDAPNTVPLQLLTGITQDVIDHTLTNQGVTTNNTGTLNIIATFPRINYLISLFRMEKL